MRKSLETVGVEVITYDQQSDDLPDSVFPNNWLSTHRSLKGAQSCIVTYQMMSENRQREYNPQIIEDLRPHYETIVDQAIISEG